MGTADRKKPKPPIRRGLAIFEMLCLMVLSIAMGATGAVFFSRVAEGRVEQISTLSLLTGLFILILLVASIVLSVTAIVLCRLAERTIGEREGAGATSRLEASIRLAGMEMTHAVCSKVDQLRNDPLPHETAPVPAAVPAEKPDSTEVLIEKAERKCSEFREIVLLGVKNYPGVISVKADDSQIDGVFEINRERVAICTLPVSVDRFAGKNSDRLARLLVSLSEALKNDRLNRVFLAFDSPLDSAGLYAKKLDEVRQEMDAETSSRLELFEGTPSVIIPKLTKRVGQLMTATPVEPDA